MIELLYFASQIQCGAGGDFFDIQMDVYHNQELVKTMEVGDRALFSVDSVNELTFEYSTINNTTSCTTLATPDELVVGSNDDLPNVAGFALQDSVQTLLDGLNEYQELLLVELGAEDTNSEAYDLQDMVLIVDNNPPVEAADEPVAELFAD
ncbi:MAG: hypothetical protein AAFQ80_01575 [Cyanobacteria bacterium J06621_8]